MNRTLSANTQAILLLTAPLLAGRNEPSVDVLGSSEYRRLARHLRDLGREPADLIASGSDDLLNDCRPVVERDRVTRLLGRGFLLSQAIERWHTRALWVVSRADDEYPRRFKERLRDEAPPVLYGCGETSLLGSGGLAVVGSRNVDDALVEYTRRVSELAARSHQTVVSGGARGIDQAAMSGALEAAGRVVGVLSDSLERMALRREHRSPLMDGQLVLLSPYDPAAGFNVGNAMQRNKLIYALADAALVVNSDYEKGGTWAGAVEQLRKLHFVPVYVRSNAGESKGLAALQRKGAHTWPNPSTPEEFMAAIRARPTVEAPVQQQPLLEPNGGPRDQGATSPTSSEAGLIPQRPADELFAKVTELLARMEVAKSEAEVASDLGVSRPQARDWISRLVEEGILERLSRPVRYRAATPQTSLFDADRSGAVSDDR